MESYRTKGLRQKLVKELESLGINDNKVLEAVGNVQRHLFLDSAFEKHAYQNKAFPIGHGQTISHPYTVAFQTMLLDIKKGDKVLEIGTGCGYQTSILAQLGAQIYSIERIPELSRNAEKNLMKLQMKANLFIGDGSKGLIKFAPFDKIIVTAGAPCLTSTLLNQLSVGGRMVIPIGNKEKQQMHLIKKTNETETEEQIFDGFAFVPFIGENAW